MNENAAPAHATALQMLPSVNELIITDSGQSFLNDLGHAKLAEFARQSIEELRSRVYDGEHADSDRENLLSRAVQILTERVEVNCLKEQASVINATGVIVHTNLGRAPLSDVAKEAIVGAAGYASVEYDLASGKRGRRGGFAEDLLCDLTGAEAAIIVNNCAAAALLVLTSHAEGKEVVISRGELVEIGGDFRVPDVLERSAGILREVGTTNRTKVSDYERAIGDNTGVILRVHPSNYKVIGFTAAPSNAELSELAHRHGLIFYEDAGSGALIDLSEYGLGDEPLISRSIADGSDLVTFSGDKLLGGPQSGLIVGKRNLIETIRKHPLYRALRSDKLTYAALQATLSAYTRGTAVKDIPVLRMLSEKKEDLKKRTTALTDRLREGLVESDGWSVSVIENTSVVGGGSAPGVQPASYAIAIASNSHTSDGLARDLRTSRVPVVGRIHEGRFLLDLRTVFESQQEDLVECVLALTSRS